MIYNCSTSITGMHEIDQGRGGLVVLKFAQCRNHGASCFRMGQAGVCQERLQRGRGMDFTQDARHLRLHAPEGLLLQHLS
jgi:hypothetical protein